MARKRKLEASPTADRAEMRRLLEAAKADHWDDGPRLALADWLEENGGEADKARAEVIRLQIEADGGGVPWRLAVERIRDRHVHEWIGGGHAQLFRQRLPWCRRGLLVAGPAARAWAAPGVPDEPWQWIEEVDPSSAKVRELEPMLSSPRMATVARLRLSGAFSGTQGLRLVCDRVGPGLRSLMLSCSPVSYSFLSRALPTGLSELSLWTWHREDTSRPAWEDILRCDGVVGLESLEFPMSAPDEAAAGLLAGLTRLRRFRVGGSYIGVRFPPAVVSAVTTLPLRRLTLASPSLSLEDAARLQGTVCGDAVEELRLEWLYVAGEARPFRLPRLRRLALDNCELDGPRMAALAEGGTFTGLSDLDVRQNPLGPAGLAALTASLPTGPRRLDLSKCGLGVEGARRLAAWPGLAGVRILLLAENRVTDAGVRALAESPHLGGLEAVALEEYLGLTASGVEALLRGAGRLAWLSLGRFGVGEHLAEALEAARPANLRELRVGGRAASDTALLARLRAALPGCVIGV
jgi:uncharacterized protein (TIGR02996 family)